MIAAAVHALGLIQDPGRLTTHVLRITLTARCRQESPSKSFWLHDAKVISLLDPDWRGTEWSTVLELLGAMSICGETKDVGILPGVVIECPPLGLHVLPIGSRVITGLIGKGMRSSWKQILIDSVHRGIKASSVIALPEV